MKLIGDQIFLSTHEASRVLGVTPRTLQRWLSGERPKHAPALKPLTAPNGRYYFRKEEIDRIVSDCFGVRLRAESVEAELAEVG